MTARLVRKGEGQRSRAYHEEEAEGVEKGKLALLAHVCLLDLEATGCQDDSEGEPETAVRGEGGGTEGIADGHFPISRPIISIISPLIDSSRQWRCNWKGKT